MRARHENELMRRLEFVRTLGWAEVRKKELLLWYGREQLTKGIWDDLRDRWNQLLEELKEDPTPLLMGTDDDNDTAILVWGEEGWLAPVEARS